MKEAYLLELSRTVALHPVRAKGMVRRVVDWRWSSYRVMVDDIKPPNWLKTDWLLRQFGRNQSIARKRYKAFVKDGIDAPNVWGNLKGQIYLGVEQFVASMQLYFGKERKAFLIKHLCRVFFTSMYRGAYTMSRLTSR